MKSIRFEVGITLDADAVGILARLVEEVVGKAVTHSTQRVLDTVEQRAQANRPPSMPEVPPSQERPRPVTIVPEPLDEKTLLIDVKQASTLLNVSVRQIWRLVSSHQMPAPIRIGRAARWSYEELQAWTAAGCPAQERRRR